MINNYTYEIDATALNSGDNLIAIIAGRDDQVIVNPALANQYLTGFDVDNIDISVNAGDY